jgi:hypothetical protein
MKTAVSYDSSRWQELGARSPLHYIADCMPPRLYSAAACNVTVGPVLPAEEQDLFDSLITKITREGQ